MKILAALLAVGICLCSTEARAQTTTTVTTTKGAFSEFIPASKTVVVKTEANSPLRYVVTKQTTIVDETGAPVTIERISAGNPLSVEYAGTGENLVASRIIVQRPAVVTEEHTTTTTATTRALTHDEKKALKKQEEDRKEQLEKETEKRKDALEKAKDELKDDDDH